MGQFVSPCPKYLDNPRLWGNPQSASRSASKMGADGPLELQHDFVYKGTRSHRNLFEFQGRNPGLVSDELLNGCHSSLSCSLRPLRRGDFRNHDCLETLRFNHCGNFIKRRNINWGKCRLGICRTDQLSNQDWRSDLQVGPYSLADCSIAAVRNNLN